MFWLSIRGLWFWERAGWSGLGRQQGVNYGKRSASLVKQQAVNRREDGYLIELYVMSVVCMRFSFDLSRPDRMCP
jgi:hypothetical protein